MEKTNMPTNGTRRRSSTKHAYLPSKPVHARTRSRREACTAIMAQIAGLPKPVVGTISVIDENTLQTRVVRAGKTRYGSVSIARHGHDPIQAYRVALLELEELAPEVGPRTNLRLRCAPAKTSGLPVGVSFGTHHDPRSDEYRYRYQVAWHDGHKMRNKSFVVGDIENCDDTDIEAIGRLAIAFRLDFENHIRRCQPFDTREWRHWRELLDEDLDNAAAQDMSEDVGTDRIRTQLSGLLERAQSRLVEANLPVKTVPANT